MVVGDFAFLFVNTALIVSCIIMSLVFLFLPFPKNKGLKNYYISLRLLALAYFSLAIITAIGMFMDNNQVNFPIELTAISLQTILFAFTLTTLFNTQFANKVYVLKHLLPTAFFVILSLVFGWMWDNPALRNIADLDENATHPKVVLNILFLIFCIAQLIYFIRLFLLQKKIYKLKLENYYADTYRLHLNWVRYCFFGASAFCILVIISMFFDSPAFALFVTCVNILFNTVFGLCYIQYPITYNNIEPILYEQVKVIKEETKTNYRAVTWDNLKSKIIADKYCLRADVNIDEMAQYLKIGRTTLSNYINKNEGMNFHTWISNQRIEEAKKHMLANPGISITQISEMVGISEPSNFSRQFKHITGLSPSIWKQKQFGISA
jgi:AraC-like DNA-binding protein